MRRVTVDRLRVGDRFRWIPDQWYGEARLTHKVERRQREMSGVGHKIRFFDVISYDLKYDAAVVNPPGITYGVPANLEVLLIDNGESDAQ